MNYIYPLLISFIFVFISELGDKTQLLVLSFSSKTKTLFILLGVALGSFFSHGIAILFGSSIGILENEFLHSCLQFITYLSFLLFGILSFLPSKDNNSNNNFLHKLSNINLGYIFIIASSIAIGEFGDKTFLASIGLGISYPNSKLFLIIGAILGMVVSDYIAICFGKFLNKKISENSMKKLSGILFIIFGFIGFFNFFF